jgi:hypothetical protein
MLSGVVRTMRRMSIRGLDPPVYGLDIETDTTVDGLDPATSRIVAVAISTADGDRVFEGPEAALLVALDAALAALAPGIVATWNGAGFDLPFLARRAGALGVTLGLQLRLDPALVLRHEPLPGETGAYRGRWHHHAHLDGYRLYRGDVGRVWGLSCGLKPMAMLVGLAPVEVDRSSVHLLDPADVRDYVASDARVTRALVLRRMPAAAAFADQLSGPCATLLAGS